MREPARRSEGTCGFALPEVLTLLVLLAFCGLLLITVVAANRDLSQVSTCTANLHSWFAGLTAYVNAYNSFPPHNPYPQYYGDRDLPDGFQLPEGISGVYGWDPAQGFIMQYGMGLTPPAVTSTGHGLWLVAETDEYPEICFCPAAKFENIFDPQSPEIAPGQIEATLFQYAACYQVSGTCRSATPVVRMAGLVQTMGGRNPLVADPMLRTGGSRSVPADNAQWGIPSIWVCEKAGDPRDPWQHGDEIRCAIQAVHPAEVQVPSRTYYMADSRDYRPTPPGESFDWPPAGINDGWRCWYDNKILLGTRHFGFANVLYLDGHVSRGGQVHSDLRWNLGYTAQSSISNEWRCTTFASNLEIAHIRTQLHIMPVLMIRGWEHIFNADGVVPR